MSVPPIVKKLSLSLLTFVIILGIPAVWFWKGRYAEFNEIKALFEKMPGVDLINAWGNEDVTFEDIGAQIRVKDEGEITFFALTRDSFKSTSVICLYSIGPYKFEYEGKGYVGVIKSATGEPVRSQFYGSAIDIGSGGEFARFFPFQLKNVRDVITRYDDICAILADWPIAPEKKHFQDEKGTDYYYSIKKENQQLLPGDSLKAAPEA